MLGMGAPRTRCWTIADATQPTLEPVPGGGFLMAFERDTPDAQYISKSNLVIRHHVSWAAPLSGQFTESNIPRTLAATAEGTPSLEVKAWGGSPLSSLILIRFHYLKNIRRRPPGAGHAD